MKSFGIDPKEVEKQKLQAAPQHLFHIIENIKTGSSQEIYTKGWLPLLKSGLIYPLFKSFAIGRNSFHTTEGCTSCKLCVHICPTKTIDMIDGKPKWSNNCVQCCACIHRCPERVIEWGKITNKQGRYVHPIISSDKNHI